MTFDSFAQFDQYFQAKLLAERRLSNKPLNLGGDGKYDSPGMYYIQPTKI